MTDFTRESWAHDLLTRMGYPVTDHNMTSVLAWEIQEGGHFANRATFNPLNSTLGHQTFGSMNGVGVATYPDYETGMTQTIKTLRLHYYDKVRSDLQAGADPSVTTADIKASPWGTWHGGASTAGALGRARSDLKAHPIAAAPATAAPTKTAPTKTAPTKTAPAKTAAPAAAAAAPVVATAATAPATAQGTFVGADVDGLDHLAQEFTQAAQIVDTVRAACEAIVAAASFFGPFGAAFVAYLKGTVIPWLTKISAALQAMSKVLTQHSTAQKDASSSTTSLPSYSSPAVPAPAATPTAGSVLAAIEKGAVAALLPGVGLATLAVGAVLGSPAATTATTAKSAEKQADGADLVPGLSDKSKSYGYRVDRDRLQDELGEFTGEKESPVHLAVPVQHSGFDKALVDRHGEHWSVRLDEVKGGEAVFAGVDDKGRPQLGGAASIEGNVFDGKLHTEVPVPAGTASLENRTTLGAHATIAGQVSYDPQTVSGKASYGVDAFAGAQNTTTVEYQGTWVGDRAEVTAGYGAGYANIGSIEFAPGEVKVHVAEGAAWGPGLKVANTVEVHYDHIVKDVGDYLGGLFTPAPAPASKH